jgi:hypothetical protein
VVEYATPTVTGPVDGLHVNASAPAAGASVPLKGMELIDVASLTKTLKLYGPAVVGVPLMVMDVEFLVDDNPAGNVPPTPKV